MMRLFIAIDFDSQAKSNIIGIAKKISHTSLWKLYKTGKYTFNFGFSWSSLAAVNRYN